MQIQHLSGMDVVIYSENVFIIYRCLQIMLIIG